MASTSNTNKDYRCGYCLLSLNNLNDPKKLPCGHVCCLPCLRDDYQVCGKETQCPQCSVKYMGLSVADLPEVPTQKEVPAPTSEQIQCAHKDGKDAVCFCMECNSTLCADHRQNHDLAVGNQHKYVPIEEYQQRPAKYKRHSCPQHNTNYLISTCVICDQLFCFQCDLGTPCKASSPHHKMSRLVDAEKDLQKYYKGIMQELSKEQTKHGKCHKLVWSRFDEKYETHDEERKLKDVDEFEQQKISEIRQKAKEMRKEIKQFPQTLEAATVSDSEKLCEKDTEIDELCSTIKKQLREMHVVDIIKRKQETEKNIVTARKLELESYDILANVETMTTAGDSNTEPQASPSKKMKPCDSPQPGQEKRLDNLELKVEQQDLSRKSNAIALANHQRQLHNLSEEQRQTDKKVNKHEEDIAEVVVNQKKMNVDLGQCQRTVSELENGMEDLLTRSGTEPPTDSHCEPIMEAQHPVQETLPTV